MTLLRWWLIFACLIFAELTPAQTQQEDSRRLGIALDYFQSGKYHEALLILQKLDKQYRLNPRFRAYLGVCYYYEWDYRQASTILDEAIPQLKNFSPQEQSVYYFADAESHFNQQQYVQALPLYQQMLEYCHDNEKADAYYKIGFIYTYEEQWSQALDNLQSALVYYRKYNSNEEARIAQIRNMINGCCEKIQASQNQ